MREINKICCVDCGIHIVTEEKESCGNIKSIEGSYEKGYYDVENDVFYCIRCAQKHKLMLK